MNNYQENIFGFRLSLGKAINRVCICVLFCLTSKCICNNEWWVNTFRVRETWWRAVLEKLHLLGIVMFVGGEAPCRLPHEAWVLARSPVMLALALRGVPSCSLLPRSVETCFKCPRREAAIHSNTDRSL